ncbi:MAG TPA: efflux RND transporter periplasmic adaptor subunit [Terracidiphilus sp.]|nr:efflux RND transporter periplasmic adaptor subunit [Terracidiphilus sp.]
MQRPSIIVHLSRRSRLRLAPLLLALAATSTLPGCRANPRAEASDRPTPRPAAAAAPLPAQTPPPAANPEEPNALHFVTSGPLVAENQADLSFDRDGRVVEIDVHVGDRVRKGQLLARLDDREAQAECKSRQAHVASLKDQAREWQAEEKAERADLKRADVMLADHIRSREDWEHTKYKLDETVQEVARYQQDALAAQADLQAAQVALDQTRLVAPFDGVIGRSSIRISQEVKKGDALFWITAEAPLEVLFTVPESLMSSFRKGSRLLLTTNDYAHLRQHARILRVSPVVDPASGSVQVVGIVEDRSPLLKPGMTMQVQLQP